LHYLEEEEEEKDKEDKEDKEVSNKPEKGSDGSNEAAKPSGLPRSASTMEDNRGSLLPTAYTSFDKRLRLPRLTSPQKRPREGKGKNEGPRKGKRKVKHVRWADAALLEEVFPFFMDSPVGKLMGGGGIDGGGKKERELTKRGLVNSKAILGEVGSSVPI